MSYLKSAQRRLVCDDAPVSYMETEAEAAARLTRAATEAPERRWDSREIARSALGDLPETSRAEFLTELLCELSGLQTREHLALARNAITARLHALITDEYDAEAALLEDDQVAEIARVTDRVKAAWDRSKRRSSQKQETTA